jgi:hypothetical protein
MNQFELLHRLTAGLGIAPSGEDEGALSKWLSDHWLILQVRAADLLAPPFKVEEVQALGQEVTKAVQELKAIFVGQDPNRRHGLRGTRRDRSPDSASRLRLADPEGDRRSGADSGGVRDRLRRPCRDARDRCLVHSSQRAF